VPPTRVVPREHPEVPEQVLLLGREKRLGLGVLALAVPKGANVHAHDFGGAHNLGRKWRVLGGFWGSQSRFWGSQGGFTYKNARKMSDFGVLLSEIRCFIKEFFFFKNVFFFLSEMCVWR
jgi:hypothetical protein